MLARIASTRSHYEYLQSSCFLLVVVAGCWVLRRCPSSAVHKPAMKSTIASFLFVLPCACALAGSAANPLQKQKIAVIGAGGTLGGLTFGFLQRCASLYGTGIGNVRAIGATAETAVRLNRILSKNFCLAVADESYIKLTDLQSAEAIANRLEGWDAIVFGTDVSLQTRSVTANTFEKSPNDKTADLYWDLARESDPGWSKDFMLANVVEGAKLAGVKHIVVVDGDPSTGILAKVEASGVPFTHVVPTGDLEDAKDFTYRKGVQGDLVVHNAAMERQGEKWGLPVYREDLAAFCVQCLLSLDWSQSRSLELSCRGPLDSSIQSAKRPDQEWCVNALALEAVCRSVA